MSILHMSDYVFDKFDRPMLLLYIMPFRAADTTAEHICVITSYPRSIDFPLLCENRNARIEVDAVNMNEELVRCRYKIYYDIISSDYLCMTARLWSFDYENEMYTLVKYYENTKELFVHFVSAIYTFPTNTIIKTADGRIVICGAPMIVNATRNVAVEDMSKMSIAIRKPSVECFNEWEREEVIISPDPLGHWIRNGNEAYIYRIIRGSTEDGIARVYKVTDEAGLGYVDVVR